MGRNVFGRKKKGVDDSKTNTSTADDSVLTTNLTPESTKSFEIRPPFFDKTGTPIPLNVSPSTTSSPAVSPAIRSIPSPAVSPAIPSIPSPISNTPTTTTSIIYPQMNVKPTESSHLETTLIGANSQKSFYLQNEGSSQGIHSVIRVFAPPGTALVETDGGNNKYNVLVNPTQEQIHTQLQQGMGQRSEFPVKPENIIQPHQVQVNQTDTIMQSQPENMMQPQLGMDQRLQTPQRNMIGPQQTQGYMMQPHRMDQGNYIPTDPSMLTSNGYQRPGRSLRFPSNVLNHGNQPYVIQGSDEVCTPYGPVSLNPTSSMRIIPGEKQSFNIQLGKENSVTIQRDGAPGQVRGSTLTFAGNRVSVNQESEQSSSRQTNATTSAGVQQTNNTGYGYYGAAVGYPYVGGYVVPSSYYSSEPGPPFSYRGYGYNYMGTQPRYGGYFGRRPGGYGYGNMGNRYCPSTSYQSHCGTTGNRPSSTLYYSSPSYMYNSEQMNYPSHRQRLCNNPTRRTYYGQSCPRSNVLWRR